MFQFNGGCNWEVFEKNVICVGGGALIGVILAFLTIYFLVGRTISFVCGPVAARDTIFCATGGNLGVANMVVQGRVLIRGGGSNMLRFVVRSNREITGGNGVTGVCSDRTSSVALDRVRSIRGGVSSVGSVLSFGSLSTTGLSLVGGQVDAGLGRVILSSTGNSFCGVPGSTRRLLFSVGQHRTTVNSASSFTSRLTTLGSRLRKLRTKLANTGNSVGTIRSKCFLSGASNCRAILDIDRLRDLAPRFLSKLAPGGGTRGIINGVISSCR